MTTLDEIEAAVDALPPEQQQELIAHLVAKLRPAKAESVPRLTPEQRVAVIHEWAASHQAASHFVDDSRESIYEGRGE